MDPNARLHRRRLAGALALALAAFALGAVVGASSGAPAGSALSERFVREWTRGDYGAMYAQLDLASRRALSPAGFAQELAAARRTATATTALVLGRARTLRAGQFAVPVRVDTSLFGALRLPYRVAVREGSEGARVHFSAALEFPGLLAGERLTRRTYLPRRATLLSREGDVLAEAPAGAEATPVSPLGSLASAVLGSVGPLPPESRSQLEAQGLPPQGPVGVSGMELALDERLRGRPGGELLAGTRVLARASARPAPPLRTSISPAVQSAAVEALGGQYGGVVAMLPESGQILGVAGIGLDGLQPPGSTFKMVTVSAVLSDHLATPQTVFAYATHTLLDGVKLENANGEECGGTLELAFAVSCNSVFAPLGVKLGATRLVGMAEAFGFNHQPPITGAAESTLPAAREIEGELELGSTAIGQGRVLASPLAMATVAATIADGGRRPQPSFLLGAAPGPRALGVHVAHEVRGLMEGVVREGTGTAAAIPGVTVAGKTGTAELGGPCAPSEGGSAPAKGAETSAACKSPEAQNANTDAWFAAFAPALTPRIVVGVLLVKDGAGGATAAPVAREVIEAALRAGL